MGGGGGEGYLDIPIVSSQGLPAVECQESSE